MSGRIYLSPPDVGEAERLGLLRAFDSNWIAPLGPEVDAFEAELAEKLEVSAAAALSSGTAAVHLALRLLDIGPGDEVWTATLTFAATANAVLYVGATPVFIDSDRTTWNLDPSLLEEALESAAKQGRLPKAVVAVDIYGQCADYDRISAACDTHGVPLIEDAAEALGARYRDRPAGSFGRIGVLSFNGNKIITTSGGGALVSSDASLVDRARWLAAQAREPVPHYEHREVGYNYRMSNLLAAVGRAQLGRLDGFVDRRRAINRAYQEALGGLEGVEFMPEAPHHRSSRWLTCVLLDAERLGVDREAVRLHLDASNIEARPVWKPMHLQPAYRDYRVLGGAVAEELFDQGLCLPSGSSLADEDVDRIVQLVLETPGLQSASRAAGGTS